MTRRVKNIQESKRAICADPKQPDFNELRSLAVARRDGLLADINKTKAEFEKSAQLVRTTLDGLIGQVNKAQGEVEAYDKLIGSKP